MKRAVFILGKVLEYLLLAAFFAPFALLTLVPAVVLGVCAAGMVGLALVVVLIMAVLIATVTTWPFWFCAVIAGFITMAVILMEVTKTDGEVRDCDQRDCQQTGVNPLLALVAGLYLGGVWFGGREG